MCYLTLVFIMLGIHFHGEEDEVKLGYYFEMLFLFIIIPSVISFYGFYFYLFPDFLQQKKFWAGLANGVLIAIGASFFGVLGLYLKNDEEVYCADEEGIFGPLLFMVLVALITGVVALVIRGCITWFEEMKLKEALQQKNHEMELALVKAQLDPHFLFNTINNIDVLILKDAEEASNYLNKLSDIMRFMLFETKSEEILLSKELRYIEEYIALQRIRTANATYINFQIQGEAGHKKIAPMVFIPFIENAFKHTTNKKLDNAININIRIEEGSVQLICENKFDPTRKKEDDHNGLGNELIQKRLQLIYPETHQLELLRKDNSYRVELNIKLLYQIVKAPAI